MWIRCVVSVAALFVTCDGVTAAQDPDLEATVQKWVTALEADRRSDRIAAKRELMALGAPIRPLLDTMSPPRGFEARRAFEYIRANLPEPVQTISVAAGTYTIGSDHVIDRNPRSQVNLEAYTIDHIEVTNFQYEQFVRETGATPPLHFEHGMAPYGTEGEPVAGVDYVAASEFAKWVGGRLPTGEEWEVAAHGGRATAYPWGDEDPERLENCRGRVVPAASEPKDTSPLGCRDMAASVAEWVTMDGGRAGIRGGSFGSRISFLRVTRATVLEIPVIRRNTLGFRVVNRRSPKP